MLANLRRPQIPRGAVEIRMCDTPRYASKIQATYGFGKLRRPVWGITAAPIRGASVPAETVGRDGIARDVCGAQLITSVAKGVALRCRYVVAEELKKI